MVLSLIQVYSTIDTYRSWINFVVHKLSVFSKIPGPKTIPILGNALDLFVEPAEFFRVLSTELCKYPGGIARIWIGSEPYCLFYSADKVEVLLSSQKYLDKSIDYNALHPWLGTGLLTSTETAMGRSINAQDNENSDYNREDLHGTSDSALVANRTNFQSFGIR
ncbi:cytochrome P450 4c3 [Armadillidium vulgare]|nr:cytochrome P450 4c3 [Armadillidium vulgare]